MLSKLLRALPPFKGKIRIAKWLLNYPSETRDVDVVGRHGCVYRLPNLTENIGFEILVNGVYEPETVNFLVRQLPPNSVLVDIGANIGAVTIPVMAKRRDLQARCVEAAPWIYRYLRENVEKNGMHRVRTINKAITEKDHDVVAFYSPDDKYGKGSLAPVFTERSVTVGTITLDTLLSDLDVNSIGIIKIDVEGFESQAFEGSRRILSAPDGPDLFFEFVDWAEALACGGRTGVAQEKLLSFGYRLFRYGSGGRKIRLTSPLRKGAAMIYATKKAGAL